MTIIEVERAIDLIIKNVDCIAWADYQDSGNSCTGRLDIFASYQDLTDAAESLKKVRIAMPKYSNRHLNMNSALSQHLGAKCTQYDHLTKILSRILDTENTEFIYFQQMVMFSKEVQKRMREKGLTQISSLDEVFC